TVEETPKHSVSKASCAASDQQHLVFEYRHILKLNYFCLLLSDTLHKDYLYWIMGFHYSEVTFP
ncbi:MAG: hypothetical protein LIO65_05225, partial [Odoribacter sp.]|nr:hypothetical protein [Odoribacter sp.]